MAQKFAVQSVFKMIDKFTAPLRKIQNNVRNFTRSTRRHLRNTQRSFDKVGAGIKRMSMIAVASFGAMSFAAADVINVGADFEQSIAVAASKLGGDIRPGTEAFNKLAEAAKKVGSTTEFTASQSAEALSFLAMAGFTAEESIASLPGVVDLATAAQLDLARATDIATDSMGAFNLQGKTAAEKQANLARISDVMAKITASANVNMEDLFETIKQAGPVGTAAGQSIETIVAMIGALANAGIKGSRAGTGLKNVFLAMSNPASKAAGIFRELGVATTNTDGSIRNSIDVFKDFVNATKGLDDSTRIGVFEQMFGKLPIAAAINLANSVDDMVKSEKALGDATRETARQASIQRDTTRGRLNVLKSAIEGVKLEIFDLNKGPLNETVVLMTKWVADNKEGIATGIGGAVKFLREKFDSIVTVIKVIGGLLAIFVLWGVYIKVVSLGLFIITAVTKAWTAGVWLFNIAAKAWAAIMWVVNAAMAANPVVLITLGIVALIAVIVSLIIYWKELIDWFSDTTIGKYFASLGDDIGAFVFNAVQTIMSIPEMIKESFISAVGFIKSMFTDMLANITGGVIDFGNTVKDFFGFGGGDEIIKIVPEVAKVVEPIQPKIVPEVAKVVEPIQPKILPDVAKTVEPILPKISNVIPITAARDALANAAEQTEDETPSSQIVSPQDQLAQSLTESNITTKNEVTIKDETGRAESDQPLPPNVKLQSTGGF